MILVLGLCSLIAVLGVTPMIIRYAKATGRLDVPSDRKMHTVPTPRVGGHVFIPVIFILWLFAVPEWNSDVLSLLAATSILFVIGILDDFKELSHRIKLPFQFLASALVIYYWDLVPMDMGGALGIHSIHGWWGWLLMLLFFQFTINAVNYADGINGLLGGYALLVFGFLGIWSYAAGAFQLWTLLFIFCAGLLGFMFFNFRTQANTFMGDSGSTVIGLLAAMITARMIQLIPSVNLKIVDITTVMPTFWVFVLLFWYPLFDSIIVYGRRLLKGMSPFKADRRHFHHFLMEKTKNNHLLSSLFILTVTLLIILGLVVSL